MLIDAKDVPKELVDKLEGWKSLKNIWLKRANEAIGYFYNDIEETGTTYTGDQYENIKRTTNIPVSINILYPVLSQKHAILSSGKPSHKVVSLSDNEQAKGAAYVLDKAKHAIMYSSEALTHNEESIKELLITGMSHVGLVDKEFANYGEFNLAYQHLSINNVTIDPNSRLKTNEDMEGWLYEKELTEDTIVKVYGGMLTDINEYYGLDLKIEDFFTNTASGLPKQAQVESVAQMRKGLVRKFYDKTIAEMLLIRNPETSDIDRVFRENMFPEAAEIVLDNADVVRTEVNRYVRETTILGDKIINVEIKPYTLHHMKTQYFEWGGKPYRSYGMIHFTKGMQEALDKTIQQLILNAMLSNNAGWTSPVGAIDEGQESNWRIDGANPMAVKTWNPVVIDGQVLKPERDQVQPLQAHYPLIMDMMKQGIEYSTGINPIVQGNPQEAKVDVFSSLQQYQSAAMQRIQLAASHINQTQEYIGRVLVQRLIAELKPKQYFNFFDDTGKFKESTITADIIQLMAVENFTVLAVPSESTPSHRMAMATELMKIAQTTPDPQERNVYIKRSFSLSDIRGFDEMQEELNEIKKLTDKIEQLEKQIERDGELMKQFENRALLAEYKQRVAELLAGANEDIVKAVTKAEGEIKLNVEKEKNKSNGTE